jgi:hypothetical protein
MVIRFVLLNAFKLIIQLVGKEALWMPIVCHLSRVLKRVVKDLTSGADPRLTILQENRYVSYFWVIDHLSCRLRSLKVREVWNALI